jgi:hypothetical protein
MDITKVVLTFVTLCVIVWLTFSIHVSLKLHELTWSQRVIQSKIDTFILKQELCLKRVNHERYKEQRVTGPQG